MYDRGLTLDVLRQLQGAALTILERFESIKSVSDYTDSPKGLEKLDAVCMLLIAIGESLKNLIKLQTIHCCLNIRKLTGKRPKDYGISFHINILT